LKDFYFLPLSVVLQTYDYLGYFQTLLFIPVICGLLELSIWDLIYFVYPCPVETSRGSILLLWNSQTGSLLVFVLAAFCLTKSLLCNVAVFTGMLYISESSQ
jgi:hypothetical protein